MAKLHNIVLFTESYPYEAITEEVFVEPDVIALSKVFDKVYIIPLVKSGQLKKLPDLPNVIVDTTLACNKFQHSRLRKSILSFHPFVIYHSFRNLFEANTLKEWLKGHFYNINSISIAHIVKKTLHRYSLHPKDTLLYTFWFLNTTTALCRLSNDKESWKIVSRAHNHDIYENQLQDTFISHHLREFTLKHLHMVYPVSKDAESYLHTNYPVYRSKIQLRTIGSEKLFNIINKPTDTTTSNHFTILSVSRVVPVKRVLFNLQVIKEVAKLNPYIHFNWIHIGGGELFAELKNAVNNTRIHNLTIELKGALSNIEIHKLYKTKPIDLFLLLSTIEGLPIALCEAMSYGVPVVATDVGGNREIISSKNGILINIDFTEYDIAHQITELAANSIQRERMREESYRIWENNLNASFLREKFAYELHSILNFKD